MKNLLNLLVVSFLIISCDNNKETLILPLAGNNADISARIYRSSGISIPDSSATKIAFTNETFDTDNMHDNIIYPSRLTVHTPGLYFIHADACFVNNATGTRFVHVYRNNTPLQWNNTNADTTGYFTSVETSELYYLYEGDYIELLVTQTSGGNLDLICTATNTVLYMYRISD